MAIVLVRLPDSVGVSLSALCLALTLFYCAYLQLNDPDPELWVTFYAVSGSETPHAKV